MNAVEYIQKEQDGLQAQLDYYRKEIARKAEVVEHLPKEIRELPGISFVIWFYDKNSLIRFNDPDAWKTLKMAGVTGLKRVFGGQNEDDWKWEGGKLVTPDGYAYDIEITKAERPVACRLEEEVSTITVKRLIAICPETMEPV